MLFRSPHTLIDGGDDKLPSLFIAPKCPTLIKLGVSPIITSVELDL